MLRGRGAFAVSFSTVKQKNSLCQRQETSTEISNLTKVMKIKAGGWLFAGNTMNMKSDSFLCPLCGGEKAPGKTTLTVELGYGVVEIRDVPAKVCVLCGADWIDDAVAEQIECLARIGRAALDNPDLPVSFIAESLASLAEPREQSTPFVPRSFRPGFEEK